MFRGTDLIWYVVLRIVLLLYRPGSVTSAFFIELADVLDQLSTLVDPMLLAGDVNIRLDRTTDPNTVEFSEPLVGYGLVQQVHDVTHDTGESWT